MPRKNLIAKFKPRVGKETREESTKILNTSLLIVYEGEKTETNYFNSLIKHNRLLSVRTTQEGCGRDPKGIVEIAIEKLDDYDEIWCVFDRDEFSKERFNAAFEMAHARSDKIKIAYSNEAFELWFLLHFIYIDVSVHRTVLIEKLSEKLGFEYEKAEDIFDILLPMQKTAIKNAQRLLKNYNKLDPEKDNPSTTVHELILRLNRMT